MTIHEFAEGLNGREYLKEITPFETQLKPKGQKNLALLWFLVIQMTMQNSVVQFMMKLAATMAVQFLNNQANTSRQIGAKVILLGLMKQTFHMQPLIFLMMVKNTAKALCLNCLKWGIDLQAKEYLKQAKLLNEIIQDKQDRLADLKSKAVSIGAIDYSKDRVQGGSGNKAPYENIIMQIVDLEAEIEQDILNLCQLKIEIINVIDAVPDPVCSLILSKKYILLKSWKQIAREMNYSESHAKKLHRKALQMVVVPEKE